MEVTNRVVEAGKGSSPTRRYPLVFGTLIAGAMAVAVAPHPGRAQVRNVPGPPTVEVVGCRFLAVTPDEWEDPVAFGVIGAFKGSGFTQNCDEPCV